MRGFIREQYKEIYVESDWSRTSFHHGQSRTYIQNYKDNNSRLLVVRKKYISCRCGLGVKRDYREH
jgi:hypothetical protein